MMFAHHVTAGQLDYLWSKIKDLPGKKATYDEFKEAILESEGLAIFMQGYGRVRFHDTHTQVHAMFWGPATVKPDGIMEIQQALNLVCRMNRDRPVRITIPPDRRGLQRFVKKVGFIEVWSGTSDKNYVWEVVDG